MSKLPLIVAASLAFASPLHAQSDADRLAEYVSFYQANNCELDRATQRDVLTAAGFADATERQALGFSIILTGQVRIEENVMRLVGEGCPIAGYTAPENLARVEEFAALIEANGCEVIAVDAIEFLGPSAFANLGEVAQIAAYLVAEDRLAYAGDPHRVVLTSEACSAQ